MIARVAALLPVGRLFDYAVPPSLAASVQPGVRVWVPWGRKSIEGVVASLERRTPRFQGS